MRRSVFVVLLGSVLAAVASGCDEPTLPVAPTSEPITTTIPGTVSVNGGETTNFVVSTAGSIVATLTTLAPDPAATVGFALGTFNGTSCQTVIVNDTAFEGAILIGASGSAGVLCVRVYDVGALTAPTSYSIEIVHP